MTDDLLNRILKDEPPLPPEAIGRSAMLRVSNEVCTLAVVVSMVAAAADTSTTALNTSLYFQQNSGRLFCLPLPWHQEPAFSQW